MDVQDLAGIVRNKGLTQDAHKACQYQEVRLETVQFSDNRLIEGFAIGIV